jgi:hypothetical protein
MSRSGHMKALAPTYGRLTVIGRDPERPAYAVCTCSCGTAARSYRTDSLRNGNTQSCGCLQRERSRAASIESSTTHGLSGSKEYGIWRSMISRCSNPNAERYADYGGRGIKVCARWRSFENFYADMGPRPGERHSIDRWPNQNGDYEPTNCRWATAIEQNRNRQQTCPVTFEGITAPLWRWCELAGVPYKPVHARITRGWPLDLALYAPPRVRLEHAAGCTTIPADFRRVLGNAGQKEPPRVEREVKAP